MIAALILAGALTAQPQADYWEIWRAGLARECPARHVDRMGDGAYDEFLDAFDHSLSPMQSRAFRRVADIRRQCAGERLGFGCEMSRSLYAAQRLRLMRTMIAFGCRTVACEEAALCSRTPKRP